MSTGWRDSARRIAPLAWPVLIGQLSVVAFGTVDTLLVARYSAPDLAALAVGAAAYITTFIGLMGVVLAVSPIVGQLFGAKKLHEAGQQMHQAMWLALALSVPGCLLLVFPWPFLALANATPEVEAKVRVYLGTLACSLPASLLFAAYRGFNTAVSRPKAVMVMQLGGLAFKVPLSALFLNGLPAIGLPAMGVAGCALATAVAMWSQVVLAAWLLHRDDFYERFALPRWRLHPPDPKAIAAQLRLGIPIGLGVLIEVSAFSMMALFIARMGTTAVAGHQVAINIVSVLFMLPLALANATSTLVAQRVGARDLPDARRLGWHGLQIGLSISVAMGCAVYLLRESIIRLYTSDALVVAAVMPLLAWVAVFHVADAMQVLATFVLRAWRVATVPMFILAAGLWGVGLGGGYVLGFDVPGTVPRSLQGAPGYWAAATAGLVVVGLLLTGFLAWVMHRQRGAAAAPAG